MSIKEQATKSVFWSAIERFSVQGIQFVLGVVIARLLVPSDYGLVAMLSIFMAVAQAFIDSGFSNALIQRKNRSEVDYSTVFYFNIVIALLMYVLMYIGAPFIAEFFKESQLELLTRWLGVNLIITGLSVIQRAKLTIAVDFKSQAKASLWAVCISGLVGLFLAYTGKGVWALIVQSLLNSLLNTILLWGIVKWRPHWTFSWNSFYVLFSFGYKLLLSGLLHTIYINLYSLVIGRFYQAADTGFYNRAYSLAQFPSINIVSVITRVVYPLQCRIQDDKEKLEESFAYYLRFSCVVIFPLMVLLGVLSKPLVICMLTDKWLPAADLLFILSISYMWYPMLVINNNILTVKGRTDYFLKAEIIKKIISLTILFLTLPYGLNALCWGILLYNLLDFVIIVYFSKKVIKTSYYSQLKIILPLLILSASMGLVVFLCIYWLATPILQLLVGGLVGVVFFLGVGYLFKLKECLLIHSLVKSKIKSKI